MPLTPEDSAYEDFMSDLLDDLINYYQAEQAEKWLEEKMAHERLFFEKLEYFVIQVGVDLAKAQVLAAQIVMDCFKLKQWTIPGYMPEDADRPF